MVKKSSVKAGCGGLYAENFAPLHPPMAPEEALTEANRCLYCYDAPCVGACPTHIEIPRFIRQIASKNLRGAAKTILEANAMGHSCGHVCPTEVLCEGACVFLKWQKKPIEIGRLQAYATDAYHRGSEPAFRPGKDNGRRVAVIGSGPSGLACAYYLRRLGHPVTVFERRNRAGGLNMFGVAEYKMTQKEAREELRFISEIGVEFRLGVEVGKDYPLSKLEKEFEAIYVGIGLGETTPLGIPGEKISGSMEALAFIEHIKNRTPEKLPPSEITIVIGAGNTSIDCATQSKRIGVPRVILAYRRDPSKMKAYSFEVELAKKDGVEFLFNAAPKRILGKKGKVSGVEFIRTETHHGKLKELKGSEFTVPCDRVIRAVGQAKDAALAQQAGMKLEADGRIAVDKASLTTSKKKFWAGGDAVNGGKEVVNAAAHGKRAAWSIHQALTGAKKPAPEHRSWVETIENERPVPLPARQGAARG